jgi:hypothetical protein
MSRKYFFGVLVVLGLYYEKDLRIREMCSPLYV